jgi:hypothetical protein
MRRPAYTVALKKDPVRRSPARGHAVDAVGVAADLVTIAGGALDVKPVGTEYRIHGLPIPIGGDQHLHAEALPHVEQHYCSATIARFQGPRVSVCPPWVEAPVSKSVPRLYAYGIDWLIPEKLK